MSNVGHDKLSRSADAPCDHRSNIIPAHRAHYIELIVTSLGAPQIHSRGVPQLSTDSCIKAKLAFMMGNEEHKIAKHKFKI